MTDHTKQQEDWAIALRFYPDLTALEDRLSLIDPKIVADFRASLLASQQYPERQAVAYQIEQAYLEKFFGSDPLIVDFARDLLLAGKRDGAKELNGAIKVVGKSLSAEKIIEPLASKYLPNRPKVKIPNVIKAQQHPRENTSRVRLVSALILAVIAIIWLSWPKSQADQKQVSAVKLNEKMGVWVTAIGNKVRSSWVRQTNEMVTCEVYIKQSRDGVVNQVEIRTCDGYASEAYRQSLISAMKNASPLPVAPSDDVFKNEIIFIFKPN